jgi:hypothetical protein
VCWLLFITLPITLSRLPSFHYSAPVYYAAPEVAKAREGRLYAYNAAADAFAMGAVLWQMTTGREVPFNEDGPGWRIIAIIAIHEVVCIMYIMYASFCFSLGHRRHCLLYVPS